MAQREEKSKRNKELESGVRKRKEAQGPFGGKRERGRMERRWRKVSWRQRKARALMTVTVVMMLAMTVIMGTEAGMVVVVGVGRW